MKYRIGLVVTATGKYYGLFPPLFESIQKYFFPTHDVRVFLFTDQNVDEAAYEERALRVIRIVHGPWPDATLRRYEYIDDNRRRFQDLDYLFYCDADMRFVSTVAEEILPHGVDSGLTGTLHPGFSSRILIDTITEKFPSGPPRKIFDFLTRIPKLRDILTATRYYPDHSRGTYETNEKSSACVGPNEGDRYYIGAFWGGGAPQVLQMSATLRHNLERDLAQAGYVAVWHDESHLNRYFIDHPPKRLPPSYCYPEGWRIFPVTKKIIALDKNHDEIREQ